MPSGNQDDPVDVRSKLVGANGVAAEYGITVRNIISQRVAEGNVYVVAKVFPAVGNNNSVSVLIRTGGVPFALIMKACSGGDAYVYFYEDTIPTNNGTLLTVANMYRQSSNSIQAQFFHTPTVPGGNEGTLLIEDFSPGGSGPLSPGSGLIEDTAWILKPAAVYWYAVTNTAGTAQDIAIRFQAIER